MTDIDGENTAAATADDAAGEEGQPAGEAQPGADSADNGDEETPAPADDRYLRLAADFENFRRRKNQELVDRSRYASEAAARALLPVLDNLHRALDHAPEASREDLIDGLDLVVREFETRLRELGVVPIDALGHPFDPAVHEALGGEESDDVEVDTVNAELQRGYRLHDRVLRPSLVRVAHPRAGAAGS